MSRLCVPTALAGLALLLLGGWWTLDAARDEPPGPPAEGASGEAPPARLVPRSRPPADVAETRRGVTVTGSVTDELGRPASRALVRWVVDRKEVATTRTDRAGRYALQGPKLDGKLELEQGALRRSVVRLRGEDPRAVPVRLRRCAVLRGVVRAADGTHVPDARVRTFLRGFGSAETRTKAGGRFALAPVPTDEPFPVYVEAGRWGRRTFKHLTWEEGAELEVVLPPVRDGAPELDVGVVPRTEDRRTMRGRVVDAAERPVEGAELRARGAKMVRSDEEGRFVVEDVQPSPYHDGDYCVYASHGDERGEACVSRTRPETLEDVLVRLESKPSIRGRVVGEDGLPVAGADVDAWWTREETKDRVVRIGRQATTDGSGVFRLTGLEAFTCRVTIEALGHAEHAAEDVFPRVGATDMGTIELRRLLRRQGRVVDEAGRPLATASYRIQDARNRRWMPVDADGTFEVLVRPDGGFGWLDVRARGHVPQLVRALEPPYPAFLEVRLRPAHVLRGRVLDTEGGPAVGVRVRAWCPGQAAHEGDAYTDPRGGFRLEVKQAGSYEVDVSETELRFPPRTMASTDGEDVVVRAAIPGRIAGTLVGIDGAPLAGVKVRARLPPAPPMVAAETGADGRFVIEDLVGATFHVKVDSPGDGSAFRPVRNVAVGREDLWLQAEETYAISGQVVWGTGRPAAEADVEAVPQYHVAGEGWVETDGQGRFRMDGLLRGRYTVEAFRTVEVDDETDEEYEGSAGEVDAGTSGLRIVLRASR